MPQPRSQPRSPDPEDRARTHVPDPERKDANTDKEDNAVRDKPRRYSQEDVQNGPPPDPDPDDPVSP